MSRGYARRVGARGGAARATWSMAAAAWCGLAAWGAAAQPAPPKPASAPVPSREAEEFFEAKVRPLLAANCASCHGAAQQLGGLRLDSRAALLKGGTRGPAVVAGDPARSLLVQAVHHDGALKMPPAGPLKPEEVAILSEWVKRGAPWPERGPGFGVQGSGSATSGPNAQRPKPNDDHWAFRPVRRPPVPAVKDRAWVKSPIDAFVLTKLEAKGLKPAPPADRRTLIRRATFDLTGLPPTAEEIEEFERDTSPDAFAKVVDRLLASPRYGERWGRYWLDVARYADTKGYVFQEERRYPYAYTYRDYVIRAFNEDLPYDQFLVQQIAADQLPLGDDKRPLAAMGFLTLGRRFLNNEPDIIDDRIDVVMRGMQGLTVTCARCHDHKFDPIPQKDYYSLYGVFASSVEPSQLPLISQPARTEAYVAFETQLKHLEADAQHFLDTKRDEVLARAKAKIADSLMAVREQSQPGAGPRAIAQKHDLPFGLIRRWKTFLDGTEKGYHPVFGPWHAFAALPDAEFRARAPELAKAIAANADPQRHANPRVAQAFGGEAPASLQDVADRYAKLLSTGAGDDQLEHALDSIGGPLDISADQLPQLFNRAERERLQALRMKVQAFQATSPAAPPRAMVLVDAPQPVAPHVFLRGNPRNVGDEVPRQFLALIAGSNRKPFQRGSGRLELARAIASTDNPLTARVMVNRVWLHHFGAGIVRTPGDFGARSEAPTHPELLDWLASELTAPGASGEGRAEERKNGGAEESVRTAPASTLPLIRSSTRSDPYGCAWKLKALHRLIMLSSTYQQASMGDARGPQVDPENRLVWKMNRQRLDLEALRDSLLFASGQLDPEMGGPSVELTKEPFPHRRTVYGFIDRQNLQGLFRTFDFATPDTTSPQRFTTTVPQQALFMMNSPFVIEQARHLASRATGPTPEERVRQLYRLSLERAPTADEIELGVRFVKSAGEKPAVAVSQPPSNGPQPLTPWEKYAQALLMSNEFAFAD